MLENFDEASKNESKLDELKHVHGHDHGDDHDHCHGHEHKQKDEQEHMAGDDKKTEQPVQEKEEKVAS